ncbi:MAG TPA: M36 family metallopeptidase [Verrucomicrobiae bacterium]|nr:M36 family metallopeptidase [Verrucomicrobiae bacterium]
MKPASLLIAALVTACVARVDASELPNFDQRRPKAKDSELIEPARAVALDRLKANVPSLEVDVDSILGTPNQLRSTSGFLYEPERSYDYSKFPPPPLGAALLPAVVIDESDRFRALRTFLELYKDLFGFDASILNTLRITSESAAGRNRIRTVVWKQALEEIPVFEGIIIANFTHTDSLVSLSAQIMPDLTRSVRENAVLLSALDATARAATNIGESEELASDLVVVAGPAGNVRRQKLVGAAIVGEAEASLVWLPMNRTTLRICWRIVLTGKTTGRLFQILVEASTGEILVRHCWTSSAVEATYQVFDKESPSPMLPGWSTPLTNQASVITQVNLTLTAYSTNASPAGWVNTNVWSFGLTNTTIGNNVDAHLDWTKALPAYGSTGSASPPRPLGMFTNGRVEFTGSVFTADLSQSPTNVANPNASVLNAFYWCNWMHDVLYELGFDEKANNFQYDNFGRGGTNAVDGDPVQINVQYGAMVGTRNAAFSDHPAQDGLPGQVNLALFDGPNFERDGALDATVILHEYTHLLSNRRVGEGVGISAAASLGLAEGWSDFFSLALLSGDGGGGSFPVASYSTVLYKTNSLWPNYYFGLRRYPYSTDLAKNPLTLRNILPYFPEGVDPYPSVPLSPLHNPTNSNSIVEWDPHSIGEVWCVALWDLRANLVRKHGLLNGNWLTLQLAVDGMNLSGPNPTFLAARDAIINADRIRTGQENNLEIWAAFAKRGMGFTATNSASNLLPDDVRVRESFSIPPFIELTNAIHSSLTISVDGTIYAGDTNGNLYAIGNGGTNTHALTFPTNRLEFPGKVKWSFGGTTNQPFNSSPALSPTGVIYAGCNDSNLYAIASSGTMIWRTNLGGEIVSSPALANDGTIYVGSGDGKLYALNGDGTVKWSTSSTGSNILSSPAIALNGTIYVGSMHATDNLYAFNPSDGAVLTGWPVTVTNGVYSSPAIGSDGSVYVGGLDGKVYAFTTNGTPKSGWPVTTGGAIWSSPAIGSNGVVYIGSTDSNLYAINPNGTTHWTYKTRGAVKSSPALGRDGTVFVGSDDFNLHVINPDGTSRWQYPIGGPVVSSPVIGPDGGLFVGSTAGNLYYLPTGTQFADGPWSMFRQNFRHTANAKTLILRTPQAANGILHLEISGPVGAECDIEVASSFPPSWSFLTNLTLTTGVGAIQTSSTNSQCYYRAKFTN